MAVPERESLPEPGAVCDDQEQARLRPPPDTRGPHGRAPGRPAGRWRARSAWAAVLALAAAVLFLAYLRLAWTVAANSDAAGNVAQAWAVLHGNPLLRGWTLSDTSFYTTELPQYIALVSLLGRTADVIHVASAMTYTLVVLLAAILAKGRAGGREGVLRMLIAAGIMLAPQPGNGVFVLLSSPGHIGTAVPLLVAWLVLDRAGRRWWVPPVIGVLLAWVLIADTLALYIGIIPLVLAAGTQACRQVVMDGRPWASARFELSLAAVALAAVPVALGVIALIHAGHGYVAAAVPTRLASGSQLPAQASVTLESVLLIFGADFLGVQAGLSAAGALLHLVGLALAGWATAVGMRLAFCRRGPQDLLVAVLAIAVFINLASYLFSPFATSPIAAREIAVVLPFAAVLAARLLAARLLTGRLLAARLARARLLPLLAAVLAAVLAGYVLTLAAGISRPAEPTENQHLAGWLVAHHLRYGIAGYWQAASTTLASGERVQVQQVRESGGQMTAMTWEARPSWFDPRRHDASFLVLGPGKPGTPPLGTVAQMRRYFGRPAHVYRLGADTVLTYRHNLLADLRGSSV